jgi:N-acetyl-gamma-glutamyl-phosphate reductase
MKHTIFVDGQEGTTGLKINDYLKSRTDVQILKIDPDKRKDPSARAELINAADIVFLCLPDEAAKESVALVENDNVRIIDASTAHRTAEGWVYGFPELNLTQKKSVKEGKRISVPGCHATGFISLAYFVKYGSIL